MPEWPKNSIMTRHRACAKQIVSKLAEKKEKQGEKKYIDNTKIRKNRGVWQDDATNFLIDVWGEEVIQLQLENCKTSKQTSKVYEAILVSRYELY